RSALALEGFGATRGTLSLRPVVGEPDGPPPTARLAVQIDIDPTTAILRYTPIKFSAMASQGEDLSYFLEFGDGQATTEASASHVCQQWGLRVARLTAVDRFGRSSAAE